MTYRCTVVPLGKANKRTKALLKTTTSILIDQEGECNGLGKQQGSKNNFFPKFMTSKSLVCLLMQEELQLFFYLFKGWVINLLATPDSNQSVMWKLFPKFLDPWIIHIIVNMKYISNYIHCDKSTLLSSNFLEIFTFLRFWVLST